MEQDIYSEPLHPSFPLKSVANYLQTTLGPYPQPISSEELLAESVNRVRTNIIVMDVARTRCALIPTECREEIEKLLTHFCRVRGIGYKQGINEILAPFYYLKNAGLSVERCYHMFVNFFDNYCLNFCYDQNFASLEIIFRMVTVMIRYHDPALARYLQNFELEPQIYCINWLMTMFSSKLSMSLTYSLWQLIVAQRDHFFIFFLVIAIIMARREKIMETKTCSIFSLINKLIFSNAQQLTNTVKIALLLRKNTPNSLIMFFKQHRILKQKKKFEGIQDLLTKIDKISVFLVGSAEVSLRQHMMLGLCEKHCYFCSLRETVKLPLSQEELRQTFPTVHKLIQMSNDIRQMDHMIDFVVLDVRGDKSIELPPIEGITLYPIDFTQPIASTQQNFNQTFLELRGHQHFLFLLNDFSFHDLKPVQTAQLSYCKELIAILNSYSYNYLGMLQGGERAYMAFLHQLRMKSQVMSSKLMPVSQLIQFIPSTILEEEVLVGTSHNLQLSQLIQMHRGYLSAKVQIVEGQEACQNLILIILEGLLVWVHKHPKLMAFMHCVTQKTPIFAHLISCEDVLSIPVKIERIQSILMVTKMSVRLHHNNTIIFYANNTSKEDAKDYRRGNPTALWTCAYAEIIKQDLFFDQHPTTQQRISFVTHGLEAVKSISSVVRGHYKEMLKSKKSIDEATVRRDELTMNVIESVVVSPMKKKKLTQSEVEVIQPSAD